jgi:raffinose/stachyose/melibiose transport system permease protein
VRGRTFLRLAVFAPFVLSEATAAVMWYELLQPGGPLDALLRALGLGGLIHYWLASTSLVLYSVFVVATWKYIGFGIVLLLAGLQGIPPELREAAAIDGASPWQVTRAITLPSLGPTIRIWIFLSVIGSFQLFDLVWIMTLGGPANASSTILTYQYTTASSARSSATAPRSRWSCSSSPSSSRWPTSATRCAATPPAP